MLQEEVILVNDGDEVIGYMPKLEAHQKGILHRAFSVFIFNSKGEMLLQKRALHKYHSAGLWSNACCSHPRKAEATIDAASRRLQEEMGMVSDLRFIYAFVYKEMLKNGLIEHEYDHVFIGQSDQEPKINEQEVSEWKYMSIDLIEKDLDQYPENYTIWFKITLPKIIEQLKSKHELNDR